MLLSSLLAISCPICCSNTIRLSAFSLSWYSDWMRAQYMHLRTRFTMIFFSLLLLLYEVEEDELVISFNTLIRCPRWFSVK